MFYLEIDLFLIFFFLLIIFQTGGSSKVISGKVFVTIYILTSHTFPGIIVKCLVINTSVIIAADITGKDWNRSSQYQHNLT